MRAARPSSRAVGGPIAPPIVNRALGQSGRRIDGQLQAELRGTLGADLSDVLLHTDGLAAESASAISASAYTVANHIVFGAGSFRPETEAGRRLLLHELVHVSQAGGAVADPAAQLTLGESDSAEEREARRIASAPELPAALPLRKREPGTVRRAPPDGGGPDPQKVPQTVPQTTPQAAAPSAATLHIVVRDRGLDLGGGILVSDLEAAKTQMMTKREAGAWTLVLSIHASQDRLGAQSPPNWQANAKFYDASAVNSLFGGDPNFVKWTPAIDDTGLLPVKTGSISRQSNGVGTSCGPKPCTVTRPASYGGWRRRNSRRWHGSSRNAALSLIRGKHRSENG